MQGNNQPVNNQIPNPVPPHPGNMRHLGLHHGSKSLKTITILPDDLSFAAQEENEVIYILARKHIITNLGWIFRTIVAAVFPPLAIMAVSLLSRFFTGNGFFDDNFYKIIPFNLIVMLVMFYYTVIISLAFGDLLNWIYNVYIITNERVIHITFRALTGTSFSEAELKNIIDISQNKYGLLPGVFDYGNVILQTASRSGAFDLKQVPDPEWFVNIITDLQEDAELGYTRGREV